MDDIEWVLAQRWIISTGVNLNNRSMQSSEHLLDFAISLRDGVILCGVANIMRPYSIEYNARKIQNIDQHEFLCKRNITFFLRTCRIVFNVPANDLFRTSDLYDLTNFAAVVKTLSILSHHEEAKAIPGCYPFSALSIEKRPKEENRCIYGWLSKCMEETESVTSEHANDGDIYEDENYCNSVYDALILSTSLLPGTAPSTLKEITLLMKYLTQRKDI